MDEKVDPYPLIWADATMRPHQPGKTCLSPKRRNQWRGWVTHARIDENKAEIVSPYSGILINMGVGNPTAPSITTLGG